MLMPRHSVGAALEVDALIVNGNALHIPLADESVQCCVTSPPFWGLRDYGTAQWVGGSSQCQHSFGNQVQDNKAPGAITSGVRPGCDTSICRKCGATRVDAQIGLEPTPAVYVANIVAVMREVWRVLRMDGVAWLNLGDSYAGSWGNSGNRPELDGKSNGQRPKSVAYINRGGWDERRERPASSYKLPDLKPKDLCGIPWRVAFALQDAGWWLRSDIIWCLSGGTWVYARTQKGDMPMTIKDMARLGPTTVKLWNGKQWTQLLGMSKSHRRGDELELVLRSGERISCTPTHQFPTLRGLLPASLIQTGDILISTRLPEQDEPRTPEHITNDAAWFAGLYIAEGSRAGDTIQISGHTKEEVRWERVQRFAESYGGVATRTIKGNCMDIRVYGKLPNAIVDLLVTGKTSKDKGFAPIVWRYHTGFIREMVDGYLSGDGHWEPDNNRWRLGFTRNYNLERDLRTACARLGYALVLNLSTVRYEGRDMPAFRGELRKERRGHSNEKPLTMVVEIRKSRCRDVYDLGVADGPHVFALASGVLSHNSKPNPMPESVTDRPTKSHEYIFLLSKSASYYYDSAAVAEPAAWDRWGKQTIGKDYRGIKPIDMDSLDERRQQGRNRRSVWSIATAPYAGSHFATFPPELPRLCILAGSKPGDVVLDPFAGSGTTGMVAIELGRRFVGVELNRDYIGLAHERMTTTIGMAF